MQNLREYFGNTILFHAVMTGLIFLGTLIVGWIVKRFLSTVGRKLIAKTESELDDLILEIILDKIKWIAIVVGAYLASEELTKATAEADITARQLLGYAKGIIFVSFVTVLTFVLIRIADTSVKYAMETHAKRTSSKFNDALLPLLNRLVNIVIGLIAIIITLHHFGQDVSSLVVSLGVGSLAIALAAQDTLANMIGGFVIMMDRPFRVGDRIKLPTGEIGDVHEIGIRSTSVLDFDNNMIVSPNAELIKARIVNFSYPTSEIRAIVDISVAYGTDVGNVRTLVLNLASAHPDVLKNPPPEVLFLSFGDSSLNLQLIARTDDFRKRGKIETTLREQLYNAFQKEGIEMPFPQRVVRVINPPHA
ncbi:MAG: mechanosensitive ion channel [Ignavibacteriales bacterium]|nr:mechanosensitive ion channel [Ignavibacteriales bacterium]